MRKKIKDWKNDWIDTNGETEGFEVIIKDSSLHDSAPCVYEGSFAKIPEELEEKKVIECGKVLDSSIPLRIGAYSLTI